MLGLTDKVTVQECRDRLQGIREQEARVASRRIQPKQVRKRHDMISTNS